MLNRLELERRKLSSAGKKIIPLYSGHPGDAGFQFPGDILTATYDKYFRNPDYHPDPQGELAARKAISKYYHRPHIPLPAEDIVITSGTSESFLHLFSLLCEAGDNVLAPLPAYPLFDHLAAMARVKLKPYPLNEENGWRLDREAFVSAIDPRTRALVIISPHNPTGMVIDEDEIAFLAETAHKYHLPLIVDEVFSDFYFGEDLYPRVMNHSDAPLVFTLGGLSKMMALPMLKLGWIVVTGPHRNEIEKMVEQLTIRTDALLACHMPIQKALPALFAEGDIFRTSYRNEVADRRHRVCELLARMPQIKFTKPQGGFYLTVGLNEKINEEDFVIDFMKETGFMLHPGYFYDMEGSHLVFSFIHEPQIMNRALEALGIFTQRA